MEYQSLFDFEQFDHDQLVKKTHTSHWHAYELHFNSSDRRCTRRVHVALILDCDGAPVPIAVSKASSSVFASLCPGAEALYPKYTLYSHYDWSTNAGIVLDRRSFWEILKGCCPPWGDEY
ncbi:hypothetical protein ES702_06497 [subsurface metagenome]